MRLRRAALAAIAICLPLLALGQAHAGVASSVVDPAFAQSAKTVPAVDVVEVSGIIDTPISEYIRDEIVRANRRKSALVVLSISSAGGLNIRTESLIRLIDSSATPIAVYIGPQRAQASGSAAVVLAAAHIAAIGPSGRLGPAHPTNLAVEKTSKRGLALREATRLQIANLQQVRGRNGEGSAQFLDRSIPASVAQKSRQVDFTVIGIAQLLENLDGYSVTTKAGPIKLQLEPKAVDVRFHKPGPVRRALHSMINAALVYVLLVAGVLLVVFEIFQPGFGVAGVTGSLLLVFAGYGLVALPTAMWAIALFVVGSVLLALDVAIDGLGPPTYAGITAFTLGSLFMFSAPTDELRLATWLAIVGSVTALVFFVPIMTIVRRARKPIQRIVDGSMVGKNGQVRSILNPEGYVWVEEGLWRARADEDARIRVGEDVTVTGVDGALITVRRVEPSV